MKFIADAMLGKLAKWLRLLGMDVLYYPDIDDRELIRISRQQDRAILTRDTRLLQCSGIKDAVFIRSDHIAEQLLEMRDIPNIHLTDREERCVVCNGNIHVVSDRREVQELVPDYVYHNFIFFKRCHGCGKVYWEGSHYKEIRERMGKILGKGNED